MVHFYHPGNAGNKHELEKIVAEQCLAWYHVNRIFERWDKQFQGYKKKIAKIDRAMHNHRKYLKAKFGALGEEIKNSKRRGILFSSCPSCGFKSFGEDPGDEPMLVYECLVCKARETGLKVECPQCGRENKVIAEPFHKCHNCGHEIGEDDIKAFLTKGFVYDKHDPDRSITAHCASCGGYESVIQVNDRWICSQCFTDYNSEEIGQCEWCNSLSTGDLEDSYFAGCAACDGVSGWESDKDD